MKIKSITATKVFWPAAAGLTLIAVGLRLMHWSNIFSGNHAAVFPGTDTYYHLYHAQKMVENFPSWSLFDPFISHPLGAWVAWPPGFDLLVALPGLIAGSTDWLSAWGACLPPILGGLSVLMIIVLTREILGSACALLAGVWLTIMFDALTISMIGRIDHHCLVAPLFLAAFYFSLKSTRVTTLKHRLMWASACALSVGYAVMSIPISPPIFFLPIPVALAIRHWLDRDSKSSTQPVDPGINFCLLLTLGASILAVLAIGAHRLKLFDLYLPSLFTIVLFGLVSAGVWLIRLPVKHQLLAMAGGISVLVSTVIFFPQTIKPLQEALLIASGGEASYAMADEAFGLLYQGELFSLGGAVSRYSYLILIAPIMWLGMLVRTYRCKQERFGKLLLLAYIFIGVTLLILQARFAEYAAPALAILFAWAMIEVVRALKKLHAIQGAKRRLVLYAAALIGLTVVAVAPVFMSLQTFLTRDPVARQRNLVQFLEQIKPLLIQSDGPTQGILSSWMDAHPLLYTTRYPVMVSSFGTEQATRMNKAGFRILLSEHESQAASTLLKNRIRYVLVSTIHRKINEMAAMAGLERKYMDVTTEETDEMYARFYQPRPDFFRCLHTKLLLGDGVAHPGPTTRLEPLTHFRLLMDSINSVSLFEKTVPEYRLFEFVPGAKITGTTRPNIRIQCSLHITTNTKRNLRYQQSTQSDENGRYAFMVPYPTRTGNAPVDAQGPYELSAVDRPLDTWKVNVDPNQIYSGATIQVTPLSGP